MPDILDFTKPARAESVEDWKKRSADGAPPGVYHPNMSKENMLKWKAKLINAGKPEARVEIQKTFHYSNDKPYPESINYGAQVKIVVSNQEPNVLISTNGKIAMSMLENMELNLAINEAKLVLTKNKP